MQYYYSYSYHADCYIPMNYLFYNWKFVHFDHFHPYNALRPLPPPLATTSLFSVSMVLDLHFFNILFLDSTYKWDYVFVFVWLILLVEGI